MAVGGREFHALARRCKQVDDKKLVAKLRRGLVDATDGTPNAVRDAFAEAMPSRGGYAATLAGSMRSRTSVRLSGSTAKVELVTWADGKQERRDLPSLNAGRLRHPTWGHRSRWATTTVPAKAYDKAIDKAADKVVERMRQVHDEIAATVMGR